MPTLIVEHPNGHRVGGPINSRVLIGRLPTNGVVLNDSSVSRLHAWVSVDGNGYLFVADTGSLTGTFVNNTAINRRRGLADRDVIRVGQTQITYFNADDLPPGIEEIDLAGQPPVANVEEAGVLFDCPCGAPAWFKASAIGHTHQCRQCGRTVRIPGHSEAIAEEVIPATFVSEPGVRHIPPASAAAAQANDPLLLHEPDAFAAHPHHPDEHGLADSGVHHAATEQEPATLTLEQAVGGEKSDEAPLDLGGLEFADETPTSPRSDAATGATGEIDLDLGEDFAATVAAAAPPHDDLLDLSGAETTRKAEAAQCSVCHSAIAANDKQVVCPSCGLTFHAECWKENLGCSAYGCPQVGVLKKSRPTAAPEAIAAAGVSAAAAPVDLAEQEAGFPWEFAFLLVAVIGALLGALSYGVPAMIGVLGTLIYLMTLQNVPRRRPVAWAALALCVVGVAVGLYVSHFYWKGWPPIGPWARSGPSHVAPGMHP